MPKYTEDSLMFKILGKLDQGALTAMDMIDCWLTPGFGYKGRKTKKQYQVLYERRRERHKQFNKREQYERDYHRLYRLLDYLQKQNLVIKKKDEDGNRSFFSLTELGRKKKEDIKVKIQNYGTWKRGDAHHYETKPSSTITIIIFDIPETEKRKRNWLRGILHEMECKKIQKSVWAKRAQLPEIFIKDLQQMNILKYVLICSVVAEGTIIEHL